MTSPPRSSVPGRFLIPVATLAVDQAWCIGAVTIHPTSASSALVPEPEERSGDSWFRERLAEVFATAENGSVAEVIAETAEDAIDLVRSALDVLRLFQRSRQITHERTFGLPGDVSSATIRYVTVGEAVGVGGKSLGDHLGWRFGESAREIWEGSTAFQFLSSAVGVPAPTEAQQRALTGAQLFNVAALEQRPGLKMVAISAALEAWLLDGGGSQTMRLARYVSWFGCGRHDDDLCGRSRPICPYLHLNPAHKADRRRLKTLRVIGEDPPWRCAEWHRVIDWYEARSHVAHGGALEEISAKDASSAEYWIAHYLAPPILEWLESHPVDPVAQLEQALDAVEDPGGWSAMLKALDSDPPAQVPPPAFAASRSEADSSTA